MSKGACSTTKSEGLVAAGTVPFVQRKVLSCWTTFGIFHWAGHAAHSGAERLLSFGRLGAGLEF